ncbi:dipeptide epimerase [Alteromonas pelagimontana]|uniref:Dipeptide epimerase n=2 Tax=Alteromonas pelagimontana TaxID=1858656 RepID=A0A6M4MHT6_9ALTE|nr:dipeptide epimerase [Alteromonas pelagimontana]
MRMEILHETFPLANVFRISRGAKTSAEVIVVKLTDGDISGWGEAVPYARYGETIDSVTQQLRQINSTATLVEHHNELSTLLPAGSARNALDCALWDLKARQAGKPVEQLLSLPKQTGCFTAQTISVDTVEKMEASARKLHNAPLIKVKLGPHNVVEKMTAIQRICANSQFIVDANEGWSEQLLREVVEPLHALNVVLIEQPLPAGQDSALASINSPVPLCADESCHTADTLAQLTDRYQAINIKLDKTGGLSEAVKLFHAARSNDMAVMVGCMVGSSLAMAPAYILSEGADYVDLDGPLLVAQDRANGFKFDNGFMSRPTPFLWGTGKSI